MVIVEYDNKVSFLKVIWAYFASVLVIAIISDSYVIYCLCLACVACSWQNNGCMQMPCHHTYMIAIKRKKGRCKMTMEKIIFGCFWLPTLIALLFVGYLYWKHRK